MARKRKVAIFDIDGTVYRQSILIALVDRLIERGSFPKSTRLHFAREREMWLNRKGDYELYIERLVEAYMRAIRGVHYGEVKDATKEIYEHMGGRVYRYTRDLIKRLKRQHYYLLAISQSPKIALDLFCKGLGFDKVYGRIYELGPSDRFTGKIEDLHLIENKAAIVRRAIEKESLTLKGSVGVGDTQGDIPFLELVEKPVCFNPNQKLLRHAKRSGWKVVVERKDAIYQF